MKLISSKLIKKMSATNKNKKENNFGGFVVVDIVIETSTSYMVLKMILISKNKKLT